MDRYYADWTVKRLVKRAGIDKRTSPHSLRRSFITAALDAGVPLWDVQETASSAGPRRTMRCDRARRSLDRHATYIVSTFIAGATRPFLAGDGLEELRAALADADCADPPWREVAKSKKAPPAVKELVEQCGVDRLLVWGGDGTVRRCISTLLRNGYDDVAVGVLPAGTGNLLAHNLGIPIDNATSPGQTRPGGLGALGHIPDVDFARNNLAIRPIGSRRSAMYRCSRFHPGCECRLAQSVRRPSTG